MTGELLLEERPGVTGRDTAASFDAYVQSQQGALVRYATLLSGSPHQAEDIVQEVLIRLYPRWSAISEARDPHAYVRRSVTNEYLSLRRRWSSRHIHAVPDAVLEQAAGPGDDRDDLPDPELWARLMALPKQQRAAVVLRYYEGLDDDEIGVALQCKSGTVRAHVSRGLATLRSALAENGHD